ncbi:MAG: GNAT family N-acetyltransferase [Treponema sp.]|nr:GNAT family N-acetyltransferase [Treponema sp.]
MSQQIPAWRKMRGSDVPEVRALLRANEHLCLNAYDRLINRRESNSRAWVLRDGGEDLAALVYAGKGLLPVLGGRRGMIPPPLFLRGIFRVLPVRSLQGIESDMLLIENQMEGMGFYADEKIRFDLMGLDRLPHAGPTGPEGLVIRRAKYADMDALVTMQAAYEVEEVLPAGKKLNMAFSRMNAEKIFVHERLLVAELDGDLVGKVNTTASSSTRCQIGGVYIRPDYRGLGIASRLTAEFSAELIRAGMGISLFVKKHNIAARKAYLKVGFAILGNYRINYYGGD